MFKLVFLNEQFKHTLNELCGHIMGIYSTTWKPLPVSHIFSVMSQIVAQPSLTIVKSSVWYIIPLTIPKKAFPLLPQVRQNSINKGHPGQDYQQMQRCDMLLCFILFNNITPIAVFLNKNIGGAALMHRLAVRRDDGTFSPHISSELKLS